MLKNLTSNETIMIEGMVTALTTWGDRLRNNQFADDGEAGKELANLCIEIVQLVRACEIADKHRLT